MKTILQRKAFALVLVMITIVLSATIAVFFLSSVGRERRGVDLHARGSQVRHLAGMTVNKMMGQINAATMAGTAAAPVSWASQPGMIRTYTAGGSAGKFYKLYSWDKLVEDGVGFDPAASTQVPPAGWKANVALFTDLNQPINDEYPIVDPRANGTVPGFSIDASNAAVSGSGSEAPMPVKWLYVLEDGQMVAPSSGSGNTAVVPGADANNPIVGRIAFWTDDETSKVNINTASEGAFWDWPKAATYNEMQFAGNPPVGGEFNRVPGHPAMTSLSAVFPELDPGDRWSGLANYRTKTKDLLTLTPRVRYADASSRGGTYPIDTANFDYGPTGSLPAIPNTSLSLKTDRLYVSPDEFYFSFSATSRTAPATPLVTVDMVRKRGFFLTANSRAPETTLFETPRVSLWPVTWPYPSAHALLSNRQTAPVSSPNPDTASLASNPWMRAEERLLAFVSTLNALRSDGGDKYYFQRQNPESPSHDYTAIRRNRELLAYLQGLTNKDIPGYGGNLAAKLTVAARDAVLANTFNVTRSLVNQYTLEDSGKMLYSFTPVAFTKFTPPAGAVTARTESGAFCPIPMKLNLGTGDIVTVSEFPVLREVALNFYATQRVDPIPPTIPSSATSDADKNKIRSNPWNWQNLINLDSSNGYPIGARTTQMRAILMLDFAPLRGSTRNNQPVFWVKLTGGSMTANGENLGFANAVAKMDFRAVGTGRNIPPYLLPFFKKDAVTGQPSGGIKSFNNGDVSNTNYGLISGPVSVDAVATQFSFNGGPITIEVYGIKNGDPDLDPTSDSSLLLGSYNVDFSAWNGAYGIPLAPRWNYYELKDEVPQYFPNPNFQAFDATKPTKWAALEIAPPYRTGTSAGDPAVTPTGYASVSPYSGLYPQKSPADGSIKVPVSMTALGTSVTYAKRDSNGELMTDFSKRLSFIKDTGATVPSIADNSGFGGGLNSGNLAHAYNNGGFPAITAYDTVLSMIADPQGPGSGDPRLGQKFQFVPSKSAVGTALMREVMPLADYARVNRQYHTLGAASQRPPSTGYLTTDLYSLVGKGAAPSGMAIVGATSLLGRLGWGNLESDSTTIGTVSARPQSLIGLNDSVGDWSSQPGYIPDGGVVPRPDQDFQAMVSGAGGGLTYQTPYFRMTNSSTDGLESAAAKGYFSPNRQIPSPITLLGNLPASLTQGWQTLAFSPNPAVGAGHPGLANPPDYLLLDLFWMPVAEPYPISEEFSTAGKINLNYKIMPFSYINRRTGLHALMKSTWMTALNDSLARDYKAHDYVKGAANSKTRYPIDVTETINRFDSDVFSSGDIFHSAAQVCSMWLVPQGSNAANVKSFWNGKVLTSDTAREQPYDHLYSRVTTKSNTFTVHWRVQALQKVPSTTAGTWEEGRDRVASELRGSTLIERFIDPNATNIPDYATDAAALPLSNFYKWRVVSENFFQP